MLLAGFVAAFALLTTGGCGGGGIDLAGVPPVVRLAWGAVASAFALSRISSPSILAARCA